MEAIKNKNRSRLIAAAAGKIPCDLTIENIQLANVITGEIYPAAVDILDGIIVRVREDKRKSDAKEVIDGGGKYLLPGLIDTHLHVESTMMTPEHFSKAVLPWGTTTAISDPHEIANVMGVEGVAYMIKSAEKGELRHYMLAPSCVPAAPGLECSGADFTAKEVGEILDQPGVIGIAELMSYISICKDEKRMHDIIEEGLKRGVFLQGHAPKLSGDLLDAYLLAGVMSEHECRSAEETKEKARLGMRLNLKASSLTNHLKECLEGIKDHAYKDTISLCTDDVHTGLILREGHLNRVVRLAIEYGAEPMEAYRFATFHAAKEYGFQDLGAIAPGYAADLQLLSEMDGRKPELVWKEGKLVAGPQIPEFSLDDPEVSEDSLETFPNTVHVPYLKTPEDFLLKAPGNDVETLVIHDRCEGTFSHGFYEKLPIVDGVVTLPEGEDLAYIGVFNRHGKDSHTIAVIRNFHLTEGAFATTIAHDSHNLIIVYKDPADALLVSRTMEEIGGGCAYVKHGEVLGTLPLPFGGLMSPLPGGVLGRKVEEMEEIVAKHCNGNYLLKLSSSALPVKPGSIMTDLGVVDGVKQEFIPQFR